MSRNIIVAGGGILGCMTAMSLIQHGHRVTLVERGQIGGHARGEASWAAAGILFPLLPWAYVEPVNRLAVASMRAYGALCQRLLEDTGVDPEYQQDGMLLLPDYKREQALAWTVQYGFEEHAAAPVDSFAADRPHAMWLPEVAHVRPPVLLAALRQWLIQQGATILDNTELLPLAATQEATHVTHWPTRAGRDLEADAFVLTAGAWSGLLLADQQPLPIKPMRGQMLLYAQPPKQKLTHIVFREGFYMVPRRDGLILAGSCLEDVGFDHAVTDDMGRQLAGKAAALLPELADAPVLAHWSGFRPGSPDNVPTIAAHPRYQNLYINSGHFRYGLTMAPASAELLANLVQGSATGDELAAYAYRAAE
jgi:glycine oxidase